MFHGDADITAGSLRKRLRNLIRQLDDDYERYTHMHTLEHHISQAERTMRILMEREGLRMAKINAKRAMAGLPPFVKKRDLVDPGDPAQTQEIIDGLLPTAPKEGSGELRDKNGNLIRTEGWAMELNQVEMPRDEDGKMLIDPTDDHAQQLAEAGLSMVGIPARLQQRMDDRERPETDAGEAVDHVKEKCRPYKEEAS